MVIHLDRGKAERGELPPDCLLCAQPADPARESPLWVARHPATFTGLLLALVGAFLWLQIDLVRHGNYLATMLAMYGFHFIAMLFMCLGTRRLPLRMPVCEDCRKRRRWSNRASWALLFLLPGVGYLYVVSHNPWLLLPLTATMTLLFLRTRRPWWSRQFYCVSLKAESLALDLPYESRRYHHF